MSVLLGYSMGEPYYGAGSSWVEYPFGSRGESNKPQNAAPAASNLQSTSTSSSESKSSSFSGIEDADTRALLKELINQMNTGGTAGQREAKAAKQETVGKLDAALLDYSKRAAFQDATDLMNLNISKSMEANKPAIQRAVEGAGTSAGSMQALLSQRLAADSSMQAGALGAEQAKAYGNIAAALLSQRGSLTKGVDDTTAPMLQAIDLLKIARSQSESKSSSSQTGYFSPQQMNVETQADKLAQIALQNQGALERANLDYQSKMAQIQAQQQATAFQQQQADLMNPLSLMNSLGYGQQQNTSSLNDLLRLASKGSSGSNQLPGYSYPTTNSDGTISWSKPNAVANTTSPGYMDILLNPSSNDYNDITNWYPSTYEYI